MHWLKGLLFSEYIFLHLPCLSLAEDGYSHYSLAVHGCRIAFLYWPLLESSRPVKFLWKLEQVKKDLLSFSVSPYFFPSLTDLDFCLLQVCDDEWHHYALNLEFPTVTLYVDGVSYDPALIHDNGLIHPPRQEPSLMIGACWAGECLHFPPCAPTPFFLFSSSFSLSLPFPTNKWRKGVG